MTNSRYFCQEVPVPFTPAYSPLVFNCRKYPSQKSRAEKFVTLNIILQPHNQKICIIVQFPHFLLLNSLTSSITLNG